jgi:hypothetical protein
VCRTTHGRIAGQKTKPAIAATCPHLPCDERCDVLICDDGILHMCTRLFLRTRTAGSATAANMSLSSTDTNIHWHSLTLGIRHLRALVQISTNSIFRMLQLVLALVLSHQAAVLLEPPVQLFSCCLNTSSAAIQLRACSTCHTSQQLQRMLFCL